MNKERILAIATWLEDGAIHLDGKGNAIGFDMDYWHNTVGDFEQEPNPEFPSSCGTAMCIGGAAEEFFGEGEPTMSERVAAEILGLPVGQATRLFYPWGEDWYVAAGDQPMTPRYMAGVLRRLVDTGELIG